MEILVNGELRELTAIGKNGIEWTADLIGGTGDLVFDEEKEEYVMDEDTYGWWAPIVDKQNRIQETRDGLTDGQYEKYDAWRNEYFGVHHDLEEGTDDELEFLEGLVKDA